MEELYKVSIWMTNFNEEQLFNYVEETVSEGLKICEDFEE